MKKTNVRMQQPEMDRRTFLTALGLGGVGFSALIAAVGNLLYLKPAVDYGPPSVIRAGRPGEYKEGIKEVMEDQRVVIVRDKKRIRRHLHHVHAPGMHGSHLRRGVRMPVSREPV